VSNKRSAILIAVSLVLALLAFSLYNAPRTLAQSTATATNTPTNTRTPTPTSTPIATPLPLSQSVAGFTYGTRCGQYGLTLSTAGDCFQALNGSGISLYSAAGRRTFHVDGETGNVDIYGTMANATGTLAADSLAVGGGYGAAGCTITSAGALSCNDAIVTDSGITSGDATGSAGSLALTNGTSNSITATGSTGALAATSLSLGGATFSGAIKYGTAASYTQGASITHGFATTPTMCMIWPNQNITSTLTMVASTFSSNMQTTGSPIYWLCGK